MQTEENSIGTIERDRPLEQAKHGMRCSHTIIVADRLFLTHFGHYFARLGQDNKTGNFIQAI